MYHKLNQPQKRTSVVLALLSFGGHRPDLVTGSAPKESGWPGWPAGRGSRCDLWRRQTAVALAGLAAAAEGLQVPEVACAAVVPGHDRVHLQGPLLRGLPSTSLRCRTRSGPWRIGEPGP
jgi:hypothetical protein